MLALQLPADLLAPKDLPLGCEGQPLVVIFSEGTLYIGEFSLTTLDMTRWSAVWEPEGSSPEGCQVAGPGARESYSRRWVSMHVSRAIQQMETPRETLARLETLVKDQV